MIKKTYSLVLLAAIALACTQKNTEEPVQMKTVSVTLGTIQSEDPEDSKTYLSGEHVMWRADDKNIACITDGEKGSNWYLFTSDENKVAAKKTFTGSIPANENVVLYAYVCNRNAVSKFNFSKSTGYTTIRNILGNEQTLGQDNTFNVLYNFGIAKPGDAAFKNVHGYLKWTNTPGGDIKAVKVETLAQGEYFAGYFDCTYEGATPSTVKSMLSLTSVNACSPYVLSKVTTSSITPDASHYIIVIPGTYHGIKLTITLKDDTSFTIKSGVTFTVERGHYLDLGVLPSQPFDTPSNGEIDFGGMSGEDISDSGFGIAW